MQKKITLRITVTGLDSIPNLKFDYPNNLEITTFFTQEMLEKGFLAGSYVTTSYCYNDSIIKKYLKNVDLVFKSIRQSLNKKRFDLKYQIKHSTFKRLTG